MHVQLPADKIATFCRSNFIRKLSLFGSVLRDDFRSDSDIDILVEFETGHTPDLFEFMRMERELTTMAGGRKVDLRTPEDLSRYFRADVVSQAQIQYAA